MSVPVCKRELLLVLKNQPVVDWRALFESRILVERMRLCFSDHLQHPYWSKDLAQDDQQSVTSARNRKFGAFPTTSTTKPTETCSPGSNRITIHSRLASVILVFRVT
jgi:hypothetical protein